MILQRGEGNRSWSTECIAIVDFIIITPYFIVSVRGCLIVSLSFCISLSLTVFTYHPLHHCTALCQPPSYSFFRKLDECNEDFL